jgi:hypothetical protein
MVIPESILGGGKFSTLSSTIARNGTLAYNTLCALGEDCSTAARNDFWDNAHTFDPSNRGKRLGEKPSTLVQCAQCTSGSSDG